METEFVNLVHDYITTYDPNVPRILADAIYSFYECTTDDEEELKMALRHFLLTVIYPACKFKLHFDEKGKYMRDLRKLITKLLN